MDYWPVFLRVLGWRDTSIDNGDNKPRNSETLLAGYNKLLIKHGLTTRYTITREQSIFTYSVDVYTFNLFLHPSEVDRPRFVGVEGLRLIHEFTSDYAFLVIQECGGHTEFACLTQMLRQLNTDFFEYDTKTSIVYSDKDQKLHYTVRGEDVFSHH